MADDNIPGMDLNKNYSKIPEETQKEAKSAKEEMEKTKKEVEKLKNFIVKKFIYVKAVSILPPQSIKFFIEEEDIPKETEKHLHVQIIVPDEKIKEIPKIKQEVIKEIEKNNSKKNPKDKSDIWLHFRTPGEIWEICMDQRFELSGAIAMSYPLYDKGILGALRVAEIHKSLVLQKFEKYVVSYVIGGSLVRGDVVKESDVDVFVVINDTDVKRMPRLELKERLRGIIYQYVQEASAMAGVENKLEPQIYLLTDFWEGVKDAHPVFFTFIRDGVPLYDRGTFMPWKTLLKMGRLKPSPEAIDQFMSMGNEVVPRSKRILLSEIFVNIFWGVTTPAQALVMLAGSPPPTAKKELVKEFKKEFLKNRMIEKKHVDFLEKIVGLWRDYEHRKIKELSGTEIDKLLKQAEEFITRLKELRKEIEKRTSEKTVEQIYSDVVELLKQLTGKKSQKAIVETFEKDFVKVGKFTSQHSRILKDIIKARTEFKKGKLNAHHVDESRKNASILMDAIIEYIQRKDLVNLEKGKMLLKIKDKSGERIVEILNTEDASYLFKDNKIKKITNKIEDTDMEDFEKALQKQKKKKEVNINPKVFELLKKEIGDFEIVM